MNKPLTGFGILILTIVFLAFVWHPFGSPNIEFWMLLGAGGLLLTILGLLWWKDKEIEDLEKETKDKNNEKEI